MTKFVTRVMAVAFMVVFSRAALADGWKIGNWEPPTKAPALKAVSLNADWGATAAASPVAAAGCSGVVRVEFIQPVRERAACSGRSRLLGWPGWRIRANRQARAQARMGSGHS